MFQNEVVILKQQSCMDIHTIINSVTGSISLLIELGILIMCIYYIYQKGSTDGKLLFIGTLINLISRLAYIIVPLMFRYIDYTDSMMRYYSIIGVISMAGYVVFAVGLILLIQKAASSKA
jgi:hypothetical protein